MPLPQQVINQLNQDPERTPGWSSGVLLFSGILFAVVLLIYFFLTFFYAPQLNGNLQTVQSKVATLDQSIASSDEAQLVSFYSQVVNLQTVLHNHVAFSQFLNWLQKNTEANVSYSEMAFASGDQITLSGSAPTEADISEQVAIFQSSPEVEKFTISNVTAAGANGTWTFSATLVISPSLLVISTSTNPTQ